MKLTAYLDSADLVRLRSCFFAKYHAMTDLNETTVEIYVGPFQSNEFPPSVTPFSLHGARLGTNSYGTARRLLRAAEPSSRVSG
jgi:hypothetical protein